LPIMCAALLSAEHMIQRPPWRPQTNNEHRGSE
jgi:hypothetical protein